ncbi:MAG: DUF1343 domain-containing protein [Chlamydiae bacterium CG10_big_fil_rev_8_21_14_0_10_42_34]|nr:MAG: DUF1343 domain-containing protein [Chlamydiae bacterium CG10_big_fil_rev_8_21_14_0_10_42_34]
MAQIFFFLIFSSFLFSSVTSGVDVFFEDKHFSSLKGKKVAVLTNHTGVDALMRSTLDRLQETVQLVAIFSPEHGLKGGHRAGESVQHGEDKGIAVYSLHGETRRPKPEMMTGIDVLIYDIQCTGVRAYTYSTTLFYMMEEASKLGIEVIVLDRPNPINGLIVDGPMLEDKWRSFIGYINVPYCHGMTIGELAEFFNEEYEVGCKLKVVKMKGWNRSMSYRDTGLAWIPPSPNVPEADTPLFCPSTGILGELHMLNIGIGFTMPFKVVGAPWVDANDFAEKLNSQKLPGVHFQPFHFRPFWGLYKGVDCEGVLIQITDAKIYKPLSVQYLLLGMLKSLYPKEFEKRLASGGSKDLFCKANGTDAVYEILLNEKYPAWKLIELHKKERESFLEKRKKYLLY